MMPNEEWRVIAVAPRYEVSSIGRVRNRETGHVRALDRSAKGYVVVKLFGPSAHLKRIVSRLVCEAFNGPPPFDGAQAAHLDGTKDNNIPENLAWVSNKENSAHREMHGNTPRGERSGRAKLTAQQVVAIRDAGARGVSRNEIRTAFNISAANLRQILSGRSWAALINRGGSGNGTSGNPLPVKHGD